LVASATVIALILLTLGLVLAYAGYRLLKGIASLLGALVLGGAMLAVGLWMGSLIGGVTAIVLPLVLGLVGALIGAFVAIKLLMLVLAIGAAIISWIAGTAVAEVFSMEPLPGFALSLACSVAGLLLFLLMSRAMIKGSTAALGSFMVFTGSFQLFEKALPPGPALAASIALGACVGITGMLYQMRGRSGRRRRTGRKDQDERDTGHR